MNNGCSNNIENVVLPPCGIVPPKFTHLILTRQKPRPKHSHKRKRKTPHRYKALIYEAGSRQGKTINAKFDEHGILKLSENE